ncbi:MULTISPECIES: helix-turn-helix transcriptional regulator [unclassified Vibrio]|uniref:helix-turn-helix transcriptional regulator n=1 Tax=unclassified Vibrio TaxID=2614977 RepID=UPI000C8334E8|nr:WYL domain-containing protein [Vibrio sp. 10N.261.54.E10]PMK12451.1 transcriptional regulator [Vibrio sp. 10N.261.54.E10]
MTIKWDQLLRFKLIEVVALWEGRVTTNHLCNSFNIKRQQASRDIKAYQEHFSAPPLVHDRSIKGYRLTDHFAPKFTKGTPNEYLSLLHKYNSDHVDGFNLKDLGFADSIVLSVPDRQIAPIIVRRLLQAARERRRVDIEYVSMDNPEGRGRNIVPHTIVFDGFRWHVRAYCEERRMFLDFVLSRFRGEPELLNQSEINIEDDEDWATEEIIEIIPNPHLSPAQQQIVKVDYGMHDAPFTIDCRRALIKYLLKRLDVCVDTKKLSSAPKKYQLTLANPKNIKRWLL